MKKFIYIAAISLAAMLSLSACEKTPDDGGDGDGTGKPGVAKPLKAFSLIDDSGTVILKMDFTVDNKGRIIYIKHSRAVPDVNIKYDNNICQISDYDRFNYEYKIINGYAVKGTRIGEYNMMDGDFPYNAGQFDFKYDASGYLTEIIMHQVDGYDKKIVTKIEWKNECLKSWYEEKFNDKGEITERYSEEFEYGEQYANISNFNPFFHDAIRSFSNTEWAFEFIYNLLGKQSKYLPVKQKTCRVYYEGFTKPGDPDDQFGKVFVIGTYEYEFNKDNTVSKANITKYDEESDFTIKYHYTFNY